MTRAKTKADRAVATIPAVVAMRQEHAIALAAPMIGVPMAGDPRFDDSSSNDPLMTRRACLYATELLRRDPQFSGDLSGIEAVFREPASVVFRTCLGDVVASIEIPARIMDFGSTALLTFHRQRGGG